MRAAGILMPIFSLPGKYGIGTFGKEAYGFVDFLSLAGQSYWQILPLSPTSYGDSPYQSFSAYAGNPYFIDLEILEKEGLLFSHEYGSINWGENGRIDYALLYSKRFAVLRKAYDRFKENFSKEYKEFKKENAFWLEDYALFMALKDANDGKSFIEWNSSLKNREEEAINEAKILYKDNIEFFSVLQFWFNKQWLKLKEYANKKGIKIIGDIPIYVAFDSAEVWCEPHQFDLDKELMPKEVAGCPPDAFSKKGQLWGNPLYNWKFMKNSDYDWWCRRIQYTLKLYDIIRIDHFRGFESYYAVPFTDEDATNGKWRKGPGIEFFNFLRKKLGELPIIAEDLGFMTEKVIEMLAKSGFPGMKVLQFAFDSKDDNDYLPHYCHKNSVVYTGTHDNDTVNGWQKSLSENDLKFACDYLGAKKGDMLNWAMIRAAFATSSFLAIIPIQDYIGAGSESRINTPSTLGENWSWRIDGGCLNDWLAGIIKDMTVTYRRYPSKEKE